VHLPASILLDCVHARCSIGDISVNNLMVGHSGRRALRRDGAAAHRMGARWM